MTAASTTHSVQHELEDLVLNSTLPVKGFFYGAGLTTLTVPVDQVQTAHTSEVWVADYTLTGVAVGDIVFGTVGVVSGLATGAYPCQAWVSATDTVTVAFTGEANTAITSTAPVINVIVADVT